MAAKATIGYFESHYGKRIREVRAARRSDESADPAGAGCHRPTRLVLLQLVVVAASCLPGPGLALRLVNQDRLVRFFEAAGSVDRSKNNGTYPICLLHGLGEAIMALDNLSCRHDSEEFTRP